MVQGCKIPLVQGHRGYRDAKYRRCRGTDGTGTQNTTGAGAPTVQGCKIPPVQGHRWYRDAKYRQCRGTDGTGMQNTTGAGAPTAQGRKIPPVQGHRRHRDATRRWGTHGPPVFRNPWFLGMATVDYWTVRPWVNGRSIQNTRLKNALRAKKN